MGFSSLKNQGAPHRIVFRGTTQSFQTQQAAVDLKGQKPLKSIEWNPDDGIEFRPQVDITPTENNHLLKQEDSTQDTESMSMSLSGKEESEHGYLQQIQNYHEWHRSKPTRMKNTLLLCWKTSKVPVPQVESENKVVDSSVMDSGPNNISPSLFTAVSFQGANLYFNIAIPPQFFGNICPPNLQLGELHLNLAHPSLVTFGQSSKLDSGDMKINSDDKLSLPWDDTALICVDCEVLNFHLQSQL